MEILKTFSNLSVDRLDGNKRPCDAFGKALSSWRHGQRTRFLSLGSKVPKAVRPVSSARETTWRIRVVESVLADRWETQILLSANKTVADLCYLDDCPG